MHFRGSICANLLTWENAMKLGVNNMKSFGFDAESFGFDAELTSRISLASLAVFLLCASTIASTVLKGLPRSNDFSRSASRSDTSSATSIADEWDEVFDTARSVLAKLPDPSRIETTIKDPALRQAVLRAYQSLKTCAKVNRDQNRSTKQGMLAEFERDFKSVRAEAERGEYQSCAATCSTEEMKCEKDCEAARKKLCACKIIEFGSLVTKCIFG